ncbi:MAG: hypothetical protein QOH93_3202 [Chloroflexia bacterium]|jgi:hypothetical protein|nr:hypothetical protein [Chloroflexia bacterium]
MKTWLKVLIVTLVVAVPAIPLGQMIWPSPPGEAMPSDTQLPFFIVLGIFEAVVLGLGVSFLAFGWPLVSRFATSTRMAWASFLSIGWLLVSWWPHDGLHRSNGMDMGRLLLIEYGFHVTLMIAGLILAYNFVKLATAASAGREPAPLATHAATPAGANVQGM